MIRVRGSGSVTYLPFKVAGELGGGVEVDRVVEAGFAWDVVVWGSGEDVDVGKPGDDVAVVVVPGAHACL